MFRLKGILTLLAIVLVVWVIGAFVAGHIWFHGSKYAVAMRNAQTDFETLWYGDSIVDSAHQVSDKDIRAVLQKRNDINDAMYRDPKRGHPASFIIVAGWWNRSDDITTPAPRIAIFW